MQISDGALSFSATDLAEFLACEHLTVLNLAALNGAPPPEPGRAGEAAQAPPFQRSPDRARGWLDHLRDRGLAVARIPSAPETDMGALHAAYEATLAALRLGPDAIYRPVLHDGAWWSATDFLIRVDRPSTLGAYSYEPAEVGLLPRERVHALLRMCQLADQLQRVQGVEPATLHLIADADTPQPFRARDAAAYYRRVRRSFEARVRGERPPTYPYPVEHCAVCSWADACARRRREDDHLSLLSGLRRDHASKLAAAGVTTVAALADAQAPVPGIARATLERLRGQARLHLRQRQQDAAVYELLAAQPGRGLQLLPEPSPADVFIQLDDDPFAREGGLTYLFGAVELGPNGEPCYHRLWAHDRAAERQAFEAFADLLSERLERSPELRVYHYGPAAPDALKRLMGTHASRESLVDRLLRGGILVDLAQVVRQALRCSRPTSDLRQVTMLFAPEREESAGEGPSRLALYEARAGSRGAEVLARIEVLNREDCLDVRRLRDWLEDRRRELEAAAGTPLRRPEPRELEPSAALAEAETRVQQLVAALTAEVPADPARRTREQQACWLLAQLLEWHRREEKPEWWAYFQRQSLTDDELADDSEALGGLALLGPVGETPRSVVYRYRFDPGQEHKIAVGAQPHDPRTGRPAGEVVHLDSALGLVDVRRGKGTSVPHPTALIPPPPLDSRPQREALQRLAAWVADRGVDADGPYRAARDLLLNDPPRLADQPRRGEPLAREGEDPATAARRVVPALAASCLPIQGPPGAGKTFTAARVVVDLVRRGQRVGITAFSHRAIGNLLDEVAAYADREGIALRALQKAGPGERCTASVVASTTDNRAVESALASGSVDVVAGTAWLFARPKLEGTLDVLLVDEAGQLSLANTLAVAGAAKSLVLLGDPQQLAQPSKGSHPPGAEVSALEHVLGGNPTIAPDRGLLLDTTWRMHPSICSFISAVAYDDRLRADPSCARQELAGGPLVGGTGLRFLTPHDLPSTTDLPPELGWGGGTRTASPGEAHRVAQAVRALVGRAWVGHDGERRPLTIADILVVAPYNAQVALLTRMLPEGARVGTVDRFQGQEAPVVFFSTAASSADDLPRGMEFLFSLNRLNVAVSRARGLAVLVGSPALLDVRCQTPEQVRLVNAFCRFVEEASASLA